MRWLGKTVNIFWQFTALACVLVALLVTLGREFSPQIDRFTHVIEDRLALATGLQHKISGLSAEWEGLSPRVIFDEVQIFRDPTKLAVKLEGGRAQLNIMRSVQEQALVFDELSVTGFSLGLGEYPEGGWGLIGSDPSAKSTDIAPIIDSLIEITEFRAGNGSLMLYPQDDDAIELQLNEFALLSDGFYRSIEIALNTEMSDEPIRVTGASEGDPRDPESFVARFFLDAQAQRHRRKQIWSLIGEQGIGNSLSDIDESIIEYSSNAWITFDPLNRLQWVAKFQLDRVPLPEAAAEVTIENLDFTIAGRSTDIDLHSINVPHIQADINGNHIELESTWFRLRGSSDQRILDFGVGSVDLVELTPLVSLFDNKKIVEWVDGLRPHGRLNQIVATLPLGQGLVDELTVKARLQSVGVDAYKNSPGLANVSGYLEATGLSGFLEIYDSPVSQHYPNIFSEAITTDSMTGVVQWNIDLENERFFVGAEKIEINDKQFQAVGEFVVDAALKPLDKSAYSPFLGLSISLKNVDATAISRFETVKGSKALKHWLSKGFIGGTIENAHLSIYGDSHKDKPLNRKILISAIVDDVDLNYHVDWPHLHNASGSLFIDDVMLSGQIESATLKGADIRNAELKTIAQDRERTTARDIHLRGDVSASLDQALAIVRETPLRDKFSGPVRDWQGQGNITSSVELTLNTAPGIVKPPVVRLDSQLDLESLEMPLQKLSFTELSGSVDYNRGRLKSQDLNGLLFRKPFSASITNHKGVSNSIQIDFNGAIEMAQVSRIINQSWMEFVSGDTKIDGSLIFDDNSGVALLSVKSDLMGTDIRLPYPLGKSASQITPMTLSYDIDSKDIHISSDQLNGFLPGSSIGYAEASFAVGDTTVPLISRGKYRVNLHAKDVDAMAWYKVYEEYAKILENADSDRSESITPLWMLEGGTDNLNLDGIDLGPVGISARITEDSSWASLEHHQFGGIVELARNQEPRIDLKFLNTDIFNNISEEITGSDEVSSGEQESSASGIAAIPNMSVHIGGLTHLDQDSGEYWFSLKNDGQTLRFEDLRYKDSVVDGLVTTQPGLVEWRYTSDERTLVQLELETSNIEAVLLKNDLPALIKASAGALDVNLAWPGGINDFDRNKMQGQVKGRFEEGLFESSSASNDVLALFNILNFAYWADRAKIANEDPSNRSVGFTSTQGTLYFDQGVMTTRDNIVVDSSGAGFELGGTFDLIEQTVDGTLIVTLPVGENVAWITALAAGLPAAAGVFVVSKLFKKQLAPLQSVTYKLGGTFDEPSMSFESLFKVEQKRD